MKLDLGGSWVVHSFAPTTLVEEVMFGVCSLTLTGAPSPIMFLLGELGMAVGEAAAREDSENCA